VQLEQRRNPDGGSAAADHVAVGNVATVAAEDENGTVLTNR